MARFARLRADAAMLRVGVPAHVDERYGVPNFMWGVQGAGPTRITSAAARPTPEQAARAHLARLAAWYRLDAQDVQAATLHYVHDTGRGGIIVAFRQNIDGVDVFRDEVKVLMNRDLELMSVSGYIPGRAEAGKAAQRAFHIAAAEAVGRALDDFSGASVNRSAIRALGSMPGGYDTFTLGAPGAPSQPIRAKRVLFHLPDQLVPGWYVEVMGDTLAESYVVSATDGSLLFRHNLIASDTYDYRVWADNTTLHTPLDGPQGNTPTPHPTGLPDDFTPTFIAPSLLSLQNGPISTNDPWLPPGATETNGNNVDAYVDLVSPDGLSAGDFRATTTGANAFDRVYDTSQAPNASTAQQMAAITQLFYDNNFMHDWYYDVGFNEAAGNAQASNYGRGGIEGDAIHAEAQDYSGTNNANMATPADGGHPRMQMYVWNEANLQKVTVNSPASVAGDKQVAVASTNPASFLVTGNLALPNPGTFSVQSTTPHACGSGPEFVIAADVNADGHPDLVTANYGSNDVSVLLSDGAGGFVAKTDYAMGAGLFDVVTADVNADGKRDLISANYAGSSISVRPGNGDGTFGAKVDFATPPNPAAVKVGRLNGDGFDDVVTANYGASTVSVYLGNGAGGFAPRVDYPTGANPNWVEIGDVNNDGIADLVTADAGANSISVLLGTGTGTFGPRTDYPCGTTPLTLALGDLNGDNKLDVVTADNGDNKVMVLLGNGAGAFSAFSEQTVPTTPVTVRLADINGDGLLDVVVCCDASSAVALLPNNGTAVLGAPQNLGVGASPYGVTIADVTGDGQPDIVSANFGDNTVSVIAGQVTPSASSCTPYANVLSGHIALIDRGTCTFNTKIAGAQQAGAIGVIVVNNTTGLINMTTSGVSIPADMVTQADGNAIKAALRLGAVNASLIGQTSVAHDGTIDNQIVAHEWAHYLSNRLIGDGNGLGNQQGGGMGEGWSDFNAMLMTVKPEDALVASNSNFSGVYGMGGYAVQSSAVPGNEYYFGVRRYPYSTDMSKNPLTFQHITDGVALPVGPPVAFGASGATNAEVHNTGEVWCNMLWECYASLLRDTGRLTFDQARDRMRGYLVAGLELTPVDPTLVEARDALLAAAYAGDPADYAEFCAAFAKRGLGTGAVAPDRFSTTNAGVVESFGCGGDLVALSAVIDDGINSCDADSVLDEGEQGHVTVTLFNPGGSVNLNATTGIVSSTNPTLVFPRGTGLAFPASHPFSTLTASLPVRSSGAVGIQTQDVHVGFDDPGLFVPGLRTAVFAQWGNVDEAPATEEHVEERVPTWTESGPALGGVVVPWRRVQPSVSAPGHEFYAPDPPDTSDQSLVSPPLQVGSGDFSFTFSHAYAFESNINGFFDGGVVEISTDGGASWSDIGGSIAPGYGGTLSASRNPLAGRAAFVGTSASYPALASATCDLGTAYAGRTVQIRFRLGADQGTGADGWHVDDIVFTGLVNAPFTDLVADAGPCTAAVADALPTEMAFTIAGANPTVGDPAFRFALPQRTRVRIAAFDVGGRQVASLADGEFDAGVHVAGWNVSRVAGRKPGVYFVRMIANGRALEQRMVLLR